MIKLTQSLQSWLFLYHKDLLVPLSFGHMELLTEELYKEYIAWCSTDEGKQYLKGGNKYKERGNKNGDDE